MNLSSIPATISLLRAYFKQRSGQLDKAEKRIRIIKANYPNMFDFIDAYHGFILINQRDIEGASRLFQKNIKALPKKKDDTQRYIELYCMYFLNAGEEHFEWEAIISEAHQLNADQLTKRMLVLPTKNQVISSLTS